MACVWLNVGLAVLGRVSSDLAVMKRAMKLLYDAALGWERLGRVFVSRRRFRFAFLLRLCSCIPPPLVLELGL